MFLIYSKPNCPHCVQAKALLNKNNICYDEINIDVGQPKIDGVKYILRDDFIKAFPLQKSMPYIIYTNSADGKPIGGLLELMTLLK